MKESPGTILRKGYGPPIDPPSPKANRPPPDEFERPILENMRPFLCGVAFGLLLVIALVVLAGGR